MAEENDSGEKSEEPTAKRIQQAREDGQVGKSNDLSQVVGMAFAFWALIIIGPYLWADMINIFKQIWGNSASREPLTLSQCEQGFHALLVTFLPEIFLLMLIAALAGGLSMALQTKFLWSSKLLKPKFSQLNPISGVKRIFSAQNGVNLLKSLFKLGIIGPVAWVAFFSLFGELLQMIDMPIEYILPFLAEAAIMIFWRIIILIFILAIIDFVWQKYTNYKELKMTKTEVKDERKSIEGDEQTKMQIRSKALQRARQRMIQDVPQADVVVTNPTHYAVALKYDANSGDIAPKVVAKGKGYVALKIREIATQHGVPVLERKTLARALFSSVEVGQIIPEELYAVVAELLAYIYKLRGNKNFLKKSNQPNHH